MPEKIKKILSVLVLATIVSYYFVLPVSVKNAEAVLGVADQTFNTTIGDIPAYITGLAKKVLDVGLKKLKKRMLTRIQNDLVNWVQGGGKPRFITHFGDFLKSSADTAAVTALDKVFGKNGIDICSPFKANVELLVKPAVYARDRDARCSLDDIWDNVNDSYDNFKNDFQSGGWAAWIKLNETNNTLPGAYFGALQLVGTDVQRQGNTVAAQVSAGKGFLDQKVCHKAKKKMAFAYLGNKKLAEGYINEQGKMIIDPSDGGRIYTGNGLPLSSAYGELKDEYDLEFIASQMGEKLKITTQDVEYSVSEGQKLKASETCIDEETVTPGSTVGEWVTTGLQKVGLDGVLTSDDIANILNAFLDAAVNRATKEGLSLMTSGRGFNSTPFKNRTASAQSQQQIAGMESPDAVNLQTQMSKLRSDAMKLKSEMQKIIKENQTRERNFGSRLKSIAGTTTPSGDYEEGYLFTVRLRADENDKTLADTLDRFFGKSGSELTKEVETTVNELTGKGEGRKEPIQFPDKIHFHEESSLPGLYRANKDLSQELAGIWGAIEYIFDGLKGKIDKAEKTQCYDIQYTDEPAIKDEVLQLPFILPNDESVGWSSKNNSYVENITNRIKEIEEEAEIPMSTISDIEPKANYSSTNAERIKEQYQQDADLYESLTKTMQEEIELLDDDIDFVTERIDDIMTYTSLLLSYDSAGRKFDLVKKIEDYKEMLGSSGADEKITGGDGKELSKLDLAHEVMLNAKRETLGEWENIVKSRAAVASPSAPIATPIAGGATTVGGNSKKTKTEIVSRAILLIKNSLFGIEYQSLTQDTTLQTGLGVSSTVAQVMGLDIGGIQSNLEGRAIKVENRRNEFSKKIGKFLDKPDLRKQAGVEGGETEWEKHFYNRFQLAYAAFIYDFYKDWFVEKYCK